MENRVLAGLEPQSVLGFFEELCRIPHGSGNTGAASGWAVQFARDRGLRHRQDALGNVVIWKEGSPGYEDHPTVMLQGHLDMVCVHEPDVVHDFLKDPLDLYVDGDYIKARGTSLGGDDGAAVAICMAVLDDDSLPHPPLEVLFTVDEEVGMPGAMGLDASDLKSTCLINLDSEGEGVLTAGCAGGARCDVSLAMPMEEEKGVACTVSIEGLTGGHSGTEIHRGFANANLLLADCLTTLAYPRLISLHGGEQDNAIPVRAQAVILVPAAKAEAMRVNAGYWAAKMKTACAQRDPGFTFSWTAGEEAPAAALSHRDSRRVVEMVVSAPRGVQSMNPDLPDQVQSSLNLGVLRLEEGRFSMSFCVRSSVSAEKEEMIEKIQALAKANGAQSSRHGDYPAWEYRKMSPLRSTMVRAFRKVYGREPVVETIHAGLECGLLAEKMPGLDAVSIGPDLEEIHSTRERMSISSVERTWRYLLAVLEAL